MSHLRIILFIPVNNEVYGFKAELIFIVDLIDIKLNNDNHTLILYNHKAPLPKIIAPRNIS